uniref:Transmembrane protein 138 n=1 Tax=Florenciella parvula TaxID=236787 RepID=A0A7S2BXW0_9STRA|mmetsp:Transcript_22034/g.45855  ORF Transcript_22034/g.45855 Transcript_22034/m.45855 type:complete len:182 (+) Transcript_22034:2-547(+)
MCAWHGRYPVFLMSLNVLDLLMNSSFEYDEFEEVDQEIVVILFVLLQTFVQIFAFITMFLMLSNTYLFQVGIIGPLITNFKLTFAIHPIYMAMTCLLGVYRAGQQLSGLRARELWDSEVYIAASLIHKLTAVIYYYNNMNTVMKLGDASLYSKSAWVQLFSQGNAVSGTTRNPLQDGAGAS